MRGTGVGLRGRRKRIGAFQFSLADYTHSRQPELREAVFCWRPKTGLFIRTIYDLAFSQQYSTHLAFLLRAPPFEHCGRKE